MLCRSSKSPAQSLFDDMRADLSGRPVDEDSQLIGDLLSAYSARGGEHHEKDIWFHHAI